MEQVRWLETSRNAILQSGIKVNRADRQQWLVKPFFLCQMVIYKI